MAQAFEATGRKAATLFGVLAALALSAVIVFDRAEIVPVCALDGRLQHAAKLLDVGLYGQAEEEFGLLYGEGCLRAALGRGMALRELGDHQGSLACLTEIEPTQELGFTLYAMERDEDAARIFALAPSPTQPERIYNLGACWHGAGDNARAILEEAMAIAGPHAGFLPHALRGIADYEEPEQAARIRAHADYLEER